MSQLCRNQLARQFTVKSKHFLSNTEFFSNLSKVKEDIFLTNVKLVKGVDPKPAHQKRSGNMCGGQQVH